MVEHSQIRETERGTSDAAAEINAQALLEEEERLAQLRALVDRTAEILCSGHISLAEAIRLVESTREQAEALIPDQMDTYDLIYGARFTRLIWQFVY